jgi:hypothetical protein
VIEFKAIKSLHLWMAACSRFSNFLEFLDLCSLKYSLRTWIASLCASNKIELLIKKKKSNCRSVVLQEVQNIASHCSF